MRLVISSGADAGSGCGPSRRNELTCKARKASTVGRSGVVASRVRCLSAIGRHLGRGSGCVVLAASKPTARAFIDSYANRQKAVNSVAAYASNIGDLLPGGPVVCGR